MLLEILGPCERRLCHFNEPTSEGSALDEVGARKLAVYLFPLTKKSCFDVFFSRSTLFSSPSRTLTMPMFEYGFSVQVCCLPPVADFWAKPTASVSL